MVNVPPIPPLLCNTPPPIDFGDDEDVDVMPPTLDGVHEDDFGDYLTVDDIKNNESLPLPRSPSVCDLPPVSIYDGLISPDEEDLTKYRTPPPIIDDKISKETKSIYLTEAFNFNINNTGEKTKKNAQDENSNLPDELNQTAKTNDPKEVENISKKLNKIETQSCDSRTDSHQECQEKSPDSASTNSYKNIEELSIETENIEQKCDNIISNKSNKNCTQNVVSIEDIEDDLSDDELYSPKIPKNFIETDNLKDYFIIQKIKSRNDEDTEEKSKDVETKSSESLDNNEPASFGDQNDELKSSSINSFQTQHAFNITPPADDDNDFGDFADFQDFSTAISSPEAQYIVNNRVPVRNINNKQYNNNDIELNDFNDFFGIDTAKKSSDIKNVQINDKDTTGSEDLNGIKSFAEDNDDEFDDFTSPTVVPTDKSKNNQTDIKENSLETEAISQVKLISNGKFGDFSKTPLENIKNSALAQETFKVGNSFGDFSAATITDDHSSGNYAEFSTNLENSKHESGEFVENSVNISRSISNDDDNECDDFADFESHQKIQKFEEKVFIEIDKNNTATNDNNNGINKEDECNDDNDDNNDDDDDDDFSDFNTAQPIAPTASSLAQPKSSPNTTTETPILLSHNLNERISKILKLMFSLPISNEDNDDVEPKTNKIQDIPFTSIYAAKALEYQWINSDTRHSFIKSLGIDSRNILFGENWNPSLPRFAANLSFNPLKPMKPIQYSINEVNTSSTLESIPISISESNKTLDPACSASKENLDFGSNSCIMGEQTSEALNDNNLSSLPSVPTEPQSVEPASLAIFENPLNNEDKFVKTPPISEMESVSTFSSPLPTTTIDMMSTSTQITNNINNLDLIEVEENLKNTLNINEVVVTSTYTGSFKETHIYTPSKTNDFDTKQISISTATSNLSLSPSKASPIDFDYEKAAMGVIIDETVVKKEYRDVEYNPPFSIESLSKSATIKPEVFESNMYTTNANMLDTNDIKVPVDSSAENVTSKKSNNDFSEYQSVPSEINLPAITLPNDGTTSKSKTSEAFKTATISHGGMILSPAILIPQAISMENQKPKIEWGDSTVTINPEELARIEELFPEPKSLKSSNTSTSSQKSTPTHQISSTPSISATVANKELEGNISNVDDDDDWSDFVSVSITNNTSTNRSCSNNNILTKSPISSPFKQRSPTISQKMQPITHSNTNNDDEWSDFVSSAPPSAQQPPSYRVPQFNSGAWQNANFYNNPLSMYHKGPLNIPTSTAPAPKYFYNNNNNYSVSQQPYQITSNISPIALGNQQQLSNNIYQQQIHVMQNFSTESIPTPERVSAATAGAKNNQFQVGSARIAPSIALIPDLGFVAPAIPTHTSFINSLPKPSINTKK